MALQKSYEDVHGTTHVSAYAKVIAVTLNTLFQVAAIDLFVYKDEAARLATKEPVARMKYRCEGTEYEVHFSIAKMDVEDKNPVKIAYYLIKETPEWTGSIDV
jgi:hypothetical protein